MLNWSDEDFFTFVVIVIIILTIIFLGAYINA